MDTPTPVKQFCSHCALLSFCSCKVSKVSNCSKCLQNGFSSESSKLLRKAIIPTYILPVPYHRARTSPPGWLVRLELRRMSAVKAASRIPFGPSMILQKEPPGR